MLLNKVDSNFRENKVSFYEAVQSSSTRGLWVKSEKTVKSWPEKEQEDAGASKANLWREIIKIQEQTQAELGLMVYNCKFITCKTEIG